MPTATDLVTDLPADFEVFGQAVDTDFVDLLGGTTGQILSKTSNTDLDFTWITNDVGDITAVNVTSPITGGGTAGAVTIGIDAATTSVVGAVQLSDSTSTTSSVLASTPTATKAAYDLADAAIAKSVVTTEGDIIYRDGSAPVRLGIGTAGQVLKVNSGATAPEWGTAATSGLNLITRNSFSNVASVAIDDIFSATYFSYLVVIESIFAATNTDDLHLQMRYGATTQTANYQGACATMGISSVTLTSPQTGTTSEFTLGTNSGSSTYPNAYALYFNRVGQSSQNPRFHGTGVNAEVGSAHWIAGYTTLSETYTGILLKSSSTNITGVVSVYGLAAA
jgi:hypothetical protein